MWNDFNGQNGGGGGGGGGGGFFNSPRQFEAANTPNAKTKKSGGRNNRTAPIVICQAVRSSDDGLRLWGCDIQIACIVAKVRHIKVTSAKIVYTLEDMTGRMKAMLWIGQDSAGDDEEKSAPNVMVDTYVKAFGSIKTNRDEKIMNVFKMFNVTNINEITCHYLQCINNRYKMEARSKAPASNNEMDIGCAPMPSNSMMGMDMGGSAAGLNPRQLMVFALIRAAKLEEGTSREAMQASLQGKMTKIELDKILEWMCGEGHIYSTIDEDHFRATDAS